MAAVIVFLSATPFAHAYSADCGEEVEASTALTRRDPGYYAASARAADCLVNLKARAFRNEHTLLESQKRVLAADDAELERILASNTNILLNGLTPGSASPQDRAASNNRLREEIVATERRIKNLEIQVQGFSRMRDEAQVIVDSRAAN